MYDTDEEYQKAMLEYFSLESYDEEVILLKTDILYNKVKNIPDFIDKMKEAAGSILSEDLEMGFLIMFSYHNFNETLKLLAKHKISI